MLKVAIATGGPGLGEALIVSNHTGLTWALPYLLWRAGFAVDVVTTSRLIRTSRFVRMVKRVSSLGMLAEAASAHVRGHPRAYDWVIASDDDALLVLSKLEWPPGKKPRYLPVGEGERRLHLYSKTGLSRVLSAGGIKTPAYRVARDCGEAATAARELGYPVFLKADASSGGAHVFECRSDADIAAQSRSFAAGPLLVQKKIEGAELDLSAIYFEGKLVHFTYSRIERTVSRFGPSALRAYYSSSHVAPEIFAELSALGPVLGASGFVTISCIEAADSSGRTYIEADMRPNVWADFSLFYGEDAAVRIRNWFAGRVSLTPENAAPAFAVPVPYVIPHFMRLGLFELLINRYGVWKFIPWTDRGLVGRILLAKMVNDLISLGRSVIPRRIRLHLRPRLVSAGILSDL